MGVSPFTGTVSRKLTEQSERMKGLRWPETRMGCLTQLCRNDSKNILAIQEFSETTGVGWGGERERERGRGTTWPVNKPQRYGLVHNIWCHFLK